MTDRTTWLRVQLNEDEQLAQAAGAGGVWSYSGPDTVGEWTLYDEHWSIATMTTYDGRYDYATRMPAFRPPTYVDPHANGGHIARWQPKRVLAVIGAHRRILDLHERTLCGGHNEPWMPHGDACTYGCEVCGGDEYPCETVRLLIEAYAGRPGFPEDWKA